MQFIYCARRDKKSVEVLGICNCQSVKSERQIMLFAKHKFQMLSEDNINKIEQYYSKKKMMWEMFVQNFANFHEFYNEMQQMGYQGIQNQARPLLFLHHQQIIEIKSKPKKVMIQRKKY